MKKNFILFASVLCAACTNGPTQKDVDNLKHTIDSISNVSAKRAETIKILRDSVEILSFPADQRLVEIDSLVASDNFDAARKKISNLKKVFPKSQEAKTCEAILASIEAKEAAIKAEEERIKALGFKAFSDNLVVKLDDITCSYSGFTFGRQFTYSYCPDVGEYRYLNADKNNIYILANLSLSTKSNYASPPDMAVYSIHGDVLEQIATFFEEYATYTSYGHAIGNYHDDSHDFSKVNSVKYKVAAEIPNTITKDPLVVLISEDGNLMNTIRLESVKGNYIVVKILNRNKI